MSKVSIFCPVCRLWKGRESRHVNRARKMGSNVYCSLKCSGLGRRKEAPISPRNPDWKALKREYDKKYRAKNLDHLKSKKAAAYKITGPLNRGKEKAYRNKRMPKHIEYCRQPEYRVKKEKYDRRRRAVQQFGEEFAEAYLVLQQVDGEIAKRIDRTEIYRQNGTQNKIKQRRRDYDRITNQPARSYSR